MSGSYLVVISGAAEGWQTHTRMYQWWLPSGGVTEQDNGWDIKPVNNWWKSLKRKYTLGKMVDRWLALMGSGTWGKGKFTFGPPLI